MLDVFKWFSGGDPGYPTLIHCLNGDWGVIFSVILLCLFNLLGYVLIARYWASCEKKQIYKKTKSRQILKNLRWIFLLCGFCGYGFLVIKLLWPAWKLWLVVMFFLNISTWGFYLKSRDLYAIYTDEMDLENLKGEVGKLAHSDYGLEELQDRLKKLHARSENPNYTKTGNSDPNIE